MTNRAEVIRQIKAYPHPYSYWIRGPWIDKEIGALADILDQGETIKAVISGIQNGLIWLGVCTDRRVVFINAGLFFGVEQAQMPLDRIQSIDHQFALIFGTINMFDGVNVFNLKRVPKSGVLPFVKATEEAMYAYRQGQFNRAPAPAVHADVATQLAKLADLKEKGYLTNEEFQEQKKKLLASH